jgi:Putative homoserine kinase type II (protein kinase fold)
MEKDRILSILQENYDYKITDIEFLRDSGGIVYIVNSTEQKFLLKITKKAFQDTILQSVKVICYLFENNFPVPAVIKTKAGTPILEISKEKEKYLFILYEYIQGKEPELTLYAKKAGQLAGQLHKLLCDYKGDLVKREFHFFIERYIDILREKEYSRINDYADLGKKLWEHVKDSPMGVCHGDFHRGNLLETAGGKLYLIDFDTVCIAPRMFDIVTMCDITDYFHLKSDDIKTTAKVYKNFLTGYVSENYLSEVEQSSFQYWAAIRHFQLQATIVEVYGIDCIDNHFIDEQLKWLKSWCEQSPVIFI